MEFGMCLNVVDVLRQSAGLLDEQLSVLAAAGFSYVEATAVTCAEAGDEEIEEANHILLKHNLRARRACILFPAALKSVGPDKDEDAIRGYLTQLAPKLQKIGTEIVVYGSGGARRVPDGFPHEEAFRQFCATARLTTEIFTAYGIRVAVEHLNPRETNLLVSIAETVEAIRNVDHPGCGLLFDIYHADQKSGDLNHVAAAQDLLFHAHISHPVSRMFPVPGDEEDLRQFFSILKESNYDGTVSVEANPYPDKSFRENAEAAYRVLSSMTS